MYLHMLLFHEAILYYNAFGVILVEAKDEGAPTKPIVIANLGPPKFQQLLQGCPPPSSRNLTPTI